jgi:hypothetical protein
LNSFRAPKRGLKNFFAECFTLALGKEVFAECFFYTRQSNFFAECFLFDTGQALGKQGFAECPKKNTRQSLRHSTKKRIPVVL